LIESTELATVRRRIAELETKLAIAIHSIELLKMATAEKAVRSNRSDRHGRFDCHKRTLARKRFRVVKAATRTSPVRVLTLQT
jgi:hypothetical protein